MQLKFKKDITPRFFVIRSGIPCLIYGVILLCILNAYPENNIIEALYKAGLYGWATAAGIIWIFVDLFLIFVAPGWMYYDIHFHTDGIEWTARNKTKKYFKWDEITDIKLWAVFIVGNGFVFYKEQEKIKITMTEESYRALTQTCNIPEMVDFIRQLNAKSVKPFPDPFFSNPEPQSDNK